MESVDALRDALAKLSSSDQEFARSLLDQADRRGLSEKQSRWVTALLGRATNEKPPSINVSALLDFMNEANVKRPTILVMDGEMQFRLSVAGPGSRTPGYVVVTSPDRSFDDRTFYGRIGPEGMFEPSLSLEPETCTAIAAALVAMATDPRAAAAAYGRKTGSCCFCRLPLTDTRSVEVGYGKTCARKFNLPY